MDMVKKEIRKIYAAKRNALPAEVLQELQAGMLKNFMSLKLPHGRFLLSYYPLVERHEFDPRPCEDYMRILNAGLQVALPKLHADAPMMEAVATEGAVLERNRYGLPEPAEGQCIDPGEVDFVFVPLLAFDCKGFRVGYGKGFYDRYLARCRGDVQKIGFSFFEPLDQINDIDEFDVPLNYCITPMRVYEF